MTDKELKQQQKEQKRIQINAINAEINSFKEQFQVIEIVNYDWKEINEDVIKTIEKVINSLGGFLQYDPTFEGSDAYGFIFSKKSINDVELKRYAGLIEKLQELE